MLAQLGRLLLIEVNACFLSGLLLDDLHDAGELFGAHDGDAGVGVAEEEARLEGAAHHGVVAGAVAGAHQEGNGRHFAVGDGVDQFGAVLDDSALFIIFAHHEAGDVLQEEQGRPVLVAQLDEMGSLVGRFAE